MAHRIREVSFDLMRSDECLVSERYGRQTLRMSMSNLNIITWNQRGGFCRCMQGSSQGL